MHKLRLFFIWLVFLGCFKSNSQELDLLKHISALTKFENSRGISTKLAKHRILELSTDNKTKKGRYAWLSIAEPENHWSLNTFGIVEAEIKNNGNSPLKTLFWVNSNKGWNSVADTATIKSGETKKLICNLRETFPDGTPKLNPNYVYEVQIMFDKANYVKAEVLHITAKNILEKWERPKNRMDVPDLELSKPSAGKRVQYKLGNEDTNIYSVLYLPTDWKSNSSKKYPIIVEYPGNIFYVRNCYSTGKPESCKIGYGMTKGERAIWISMPFIDYSTANIAESGWGNPDDTANYTVRTVNEIIEKFNGDKDNIIVTGFSRGAIACGFIGLRNDTIASLWKGMHCCQHYDGDGWGGANTEGAIKRLSRLNDIKVFHTDNNKEALKTLLRAFHASVTYKNSGLKAHASDMFLDERPSSQELRNWYNRLVAD